MQDMATLDNKERYVMLKSVMMEWNNISSNETRRLVQSGAKRLTEVLKHKSYAARY